MVNVTVSEILIRRLDPADDADMDAFQGVYAAAELAEDPDAALYSREDGISILTSTDGGTRTVAFGAFARGHMVGELMVGLPQLDNLDTAHVWLWVDPAHQRQGVGTKLAEHAHAYARAHQRRVCQAQGRIGPDRDNKNLRFARSLGYSLANTEIARRLRLPADQALLDRLAAEAAPYHREYTVRAVVGPVPDDLAPTYNGLRNLLGIEAPTGELEVEVHRHTTAELRVQDAELVAAGRARVAAYALDTRGVVVAYSVGATSREGFGHVDQWGTLVDPAHRGHRLGMAVKCAMLTALRDAARDKRFVETTNAETNKHMVAINQALGFEVAEVYGDFQTRLESL
jgi:GNAT superfamily N-acetyltransferase